MEKCYLPKKIFIIPQVLIHMNVSSVAIHLNNVYMKLNHDQSEVGVGRDWLQKYSINNGSMTFHYYVVEFVLMISKTS